jgi:hypothetical protein
VGRSQIIRQREILVLSNHSILSGVHSDSQKQGSFVFSLGHPNNTSRTGFLARTRNYKIKPSPTQKKRKIKEGPKNKLPKRTIYMIARDHPVVLLVISQ